MAISSLRADRHCEAIAYLIGGMELTRQICMGDFLNDVSRVLKKKGTVMCSSFTSEVAPSTTPLKVVMTDDSNDNLLRVYARPFLLDESVVIPPSIIDIALAFNAGLVFHMRGLATNSSVDLKFGLHYYGHGINVIWQNTCKGFCSNGMYWLALALLTNTMHILWDFWDTEEALACRERIHTLLASEYISALPAEDIQFFRDVSFSRMYCNHSIAPVA
eukprot:scaffold5631_cov167-Amphora_coffeaeformis.AAC.5